jgi:hypothetical protein
VKGDHAIRRPFAWVLAEHRLGISLPVCPLPRRDLERRAAETGDEQGLEFLSFPARGVESE